MTRPSYGTVGGRRPSSGGAALQWMIIGGLLSFGCSAVIALMLLTFGVIELGSTDEGNNADVAGIATPLATADMEGTMAAVIETRFPAGVTTPGVGISEADIAATVQAGIVLALAATETARPTVASGMVIPSATVAGQVPSEATGSGVATEGTNAGTAPLTDNATTGAGITGLGAPLVQSTVEPRLQQVLNLASPMVEVQGGTFTMGTDVSEIQVAVTECTQLYNASCTLQSGQDSTPPHQVQVDGFWIDATEITNQQYLAFLNYKGPGSHRTGCGIGSQAQACVTTTAENEFAPITFDSQNYEVADFQLAFPVVGVTWYGAKAYCESLGRRLPTEAEWERAARGPQNSLYPWGSAFNPDYARTSYPQRLNAPYEVATISGNISVFGAYDMAGNVAEWVADFYDPDYYLQQQSLGLAVNPTGPVNGVQRVIRGGSWDTPPFFSRSVHRQSQPPTESFLWLGFRCASDTNPDAVEIAPSSSVPNTGLTGTGDPGVTDPESLGPVPTTAVPDARSTLPGMGLQNITATPTDVPALPATQPGG